MRGCLKAKGRCTPQFTQVKVLKRSRRSVRKARKHRQAALDLFAANPDLSRDKQAAAAVTRARFLEAEEAYERLLAVGRRIASKLEETAAPLERAAVLAFNSCDAIAREAGIKNEWSALCATRLPSAR